MGGKKEGTGGTHQRGPFVPDALVVAAVVGYDRGAVGSCVVLRGWRGWRGWRASSTVVKVVIRVEKSW